MSFLLVDRIFQCDPGREASGVKYITAHDTPYLITRDDGSTVLMAAMVGEALGQLGAWSVMRANDFSYRPVAGIVHQVTIFGDARIGDTLLLETTIDACDEAAVHYHGVAKVGGRNICAIDSAIGPMLPMDQFIDQTTVRGQFECIYAQGSCAQLPFPPEIKTQHKPSVPLVGFDHIVDWQRGVRVVAEKTINGNAPYFADHFPRKPVLPLTLLLTWKADLAYQFLTELLPSDKAYRWMLRHICRVKMNNFIAPGSVVMTTMTLKAHNADSATLSFVSKVAGKRVCMADMQFIIELLN